MSPAFEPDEECPVCGSDNILSKGDGDRFCLDGGHRWNKDGEQRPRSQQGADTDSNSDSWRGSGYDSI